MKNTLWYLGFLSIASLLYFVEGKPVFLMFLAFIPYFSVYKTNDERIDENLGRATRNSFMYSMFTGVATITYIYITGRTGLFAPAFIILFGGGLIICITSLLIYERSGK
ncbi:DUF3796 domain-containing protein [Candidatus Altiarchaeota archaeon]